MMQQQKSRNFFNESLEKCVIQLATLVFSEGGGGVEPTSRRDNLKIKERSIQGSITTKKNSCSRRCSQKRRSMRKSKDKEGKEEERRKQIISPKLSSSSINALKQN
jgi:hypothetical protein